MRTIKSCRSGDIICDRGGNKAKVLYRGGPIIFRSEFYRHDISCQQNMTVMEAEEQGWKIIMKDGREPVDIKELERLMPNTKIIYGKRNTKSGR